MMILKCKLCQKPFRTSPARVKIGKGIFCSILCYGKSKIGRKLSKKTKEKMSLARRGENNPRWKGEDAGYGSKHDWIKKRLGRPKKCEICLSEKKRKYEWASKSHKYLRKLSDWFRVCTSCHRKYDIQYNNYQVGFAK